MSSQVLPSSSRPAFFFLTPPHCLKKKGTPAWAHWSLISVTHEGSMCLAPEPDFATDDNPVDPLQVQAGERTEERFQGKKFRGRGCGPQMIDPVSVIRVFHTYSHPDVIRPGEMVAQLQKAFGPFGQHLKNM